MDTTNRKERRGKIRKGSGKLKNFIYFTAKSAYFVDKQTLYYNTKEISVDSFKALKRLSFLFLK
jgi:hypothetical protein